METIRVKVICQHQPNEIVEMNKDKAMQLAEIGHVEILDGKTKKTNVEDTRGRNKRRDEVSRQTDEEEGHSDK